MARSKVYNYTYIPGATITPTNYIGNGTTTVTGTFSTAVVSGLQTGDYINISGATGTEQSKLNGTWVIATIPSTTTITFAVTSSVTGTLTTNLGTTKNSASLLVPGKFELSNLLMVTNTTRADVIYNFSDSARNAFSATYNLPSTNTPTYSTSAGQQYWDGFTKFVLAYFPSTNYAINDRLQIYVEESNSQTRIMPAETTMDPANKMRVSTPQALIDTDFELGLQPSKWEFSQAHNNTNSYYVRPSDSPLPALFGGMGIGILAPSVTVSGQVATITGLSLPSAPTEDSYVYVVDAVGNSNFTQFRYSVLTGATTSQIQFYVNTGGGTYTPQVVIIGGLTPTATNFQSGTFVAMNTTTSIGTTIAANTPINITESQNETYADGTFFVQGVNTNQNAFFFKPKTQFASQNDLVKQGTTIVYAATTYGSQVIGSNLKVFSISSDATETNGRGVHVFSKTAHGLFPNAPIYVGSLAAAGANAQGNWYVSSIVTEVAFRYFSSITMPTTPTTINTSATQTTASGETTLYLSTAGAVSTGVHVSGTNIAPGTFVLGTFVGLGGFTCVRLNQPVTGTIATGTSISFGVLLSASGGTSVVYARPEGSQLHRPQDGGVQIQTGSNTIFDSAIRQTRRYFRYQSGKGIQYSTAGAFRATYEVTGISVSGTTCTITTDQDHGLTPGAIITMFGFNPASGTATQNATDFGYYNSTFTVLGTPGLTSKTFSVTLAGTPNDTQPAGDAFVTIGYAAGSITRGGLFDEANGFYWEFDGIQFNAVRRNSINALRGQLNVLTGSSFFTGSNTFFTKHVVQGDKIVVRGQVYTIKSITSDTGLHVSPAYRSATPAVNAGNNGLAFSALTTYTPLNTSVTAGTTGAGQMLWANMVQTTTTSQITATSGASGAALGANSLVVTSVTGIAPGMFVTNNTTTGIPANTFISAVNSSTLTIFFTNALTAAITSGQTLTVGGVPGSASPTNVVAVASSSNITPGMLITGTGVPTGTYVVSVPNSQSVSVSPAINTAVANAATLTFTGTSNADHVLLATNGSAIAVGATTFTLANNAGISYIRTGLHLAGSPNIAPGTYISDYNSSTRVVTLSQPVISAYGVGVPAAPAAVTSTAAGTTITSTAHGFSVGQCVFVSGTLSTSAGSSLLQSRFYYVNSVPTANTFSLSTVPGGNSITLATVASGLSITFTPAFTFGSRTGVYNASNILANDVNPIAIQAKAIQLNVINITPTTPTSLPTTAASGTGTVATLTFGVQGSAPYPVGSLITVSGVTPTAYNGTFVVTACTTTQVSYNSTATGAQTVAGTVAGIANGITVATTAGLYQGMPVIFSGTTTGGVALNTQYYIRQILDGGNFTLDTNVTGTAISGLTLSTPAAGVIILNTNCVGIHNPSVITPGATLSTSGSTKIYSEDIAVKCTKVKEVRVASKDFNIDRFDGTGPSNYTIDPSKIQMVYIDYTWYGAGFIRWGMRTNSGDIYYAHKMQHNNNETQAYMRSGNLPGRFEVSNTPFGAKLTTAITTSGYTTGASGTISVDDASKFMYPNPGTTYTNAEVTIDSEVFSYTGIAAQASNFSPWFNSSTAGSVATATCTVASGSISTITMTSVGSGYTSEPPITFLNASGVSGFGAVGKAILVNGTIVGIRIINGGKGYTSAPTIVIGANQLTGAIREASYVTATASTSNNSTTAGSNVVTLGTANANWKVGQIIAPIAQFNNIPAKVTGIASSTSIYVDQLAQTTTSGTVVIAPVGKGTAAAAHNIASSTTAPSIAYQLNNTCSPVLQHWGVSCIMDGRFDSDKSYVFTTPKSQSSIIAPATTAPVISIRVAPTVDSGIARNFGVRNIINRMQLILSNMSVYTNGSFLLTVKLNGTSTTFTPSNWTANTVGAGSLSQVIYHNPGDSFSGGDTIFAFYANNSGGSTNYNSTDVDLLNVKDLGHSIIGGDGVYPDGPDVLTVLATNLSTTATSALYSRISWTEAQA